MSNSWQLERAMASCPIDVTQDLLGWVNYVREESGYPATQIIDQAKRRIMLANYMAESHTPAEIAITRYLLFGVYE